MKHLLIGGILLFTTAPLHAQILQNLKKIATDKAKELSSKDNLEKLGNTVMKDMDKARAQFDSTDFDYAVLLSDNTGLFDIKEKGEQQARFASLTNNVVSFWKNDELTDAQQARFNLDMGEMAYASSKFSSAEKRFVTAKEKYEQAGLTEDPGYLKTI